MGDEDFETTRALLREQTVVDDEARSELHDDENEISHLVDEDDGMTTPQLGKGHHLEQSTDSFANLPALRDRGATSSNESTPDLPAPREEGSDEAQHHDEQQSEHRAHQLAPPSGLSKSASQKGEIREKETKKKTQESTKVQLT